MNSNTVVVPYSDSFRKEVIDLILSIQVDEFAVAIDLDRQPDLKQITEFYQVNQGNFWIAIVDGVLAGTIALLDIGNARGALRKMFVKSEFRGKEVGVAQQLLNTLLQWAQGKGYQEILLGTTEKFIAAQRFYERNGFTSVARNALPPEFPVMSVDVKFYIRRLPQPSQVGGA